MADEGNLPKRKGSSSNHPFFRAVMLNFRLLSKKSPTGPTERTPKPEYLLALATYLGVRWEGPIIQFLMDTSFPGLVAVLMMVSLCFERSCTDRKMEANGVTLGSKISKMLSSTLKCPQLQNECEANIIATCHSSKINIDNIIPDASACRSCAVSVHIPATPIPAPTTINVSKPQTFLRYQ